MNPKTRRHFFATEKETEPVIVKEGKRREPSLQGTSRQRGYMPKDFEAKWLRAGGLGLHSGETGDVMQKYGN
jgi:hypothetical protein